MKKLLCILLLPFSSLCWSYQTVDIDLDSGTTMSVNQFRGEGKKLVLWLPSERGFGKGYVSVALNLAVLDYDVWAVQLHDSYIIPTSRQSLNEVSLDDLLDILNIARQQGFEDIYLLSSSRGVLLSLKLAWLYQKKYESTGLLKGLLMFSPYLIMGRTEMGGNATYQDMARHSNLPVYMLQAEYDTKFARSLEIAEQLKRGGSPVFIHALRGTRGGFYMRPDEDLSKRDLQMRDMLAAILHNAISLLGSVKAAPFDGDYQIPSDHIDDGKIRFETVTLNPYMGDRIPPTLQLENLQQQLISLQDFGGRVVLVNFWATWCKPCVEEIPSLSRLVTQMQGKPFKVIAVNIGEPAAVINEFVESIPVNFDILLDKESTAVRHWKVYAYPSSFLLDKNGHIRFAYRGALRWDGNDIVNTIESLF